MTNRSFRLSAGTLAGTLLVLLVAGICARLGIWQLDRRTERQARNVVIEERLGLPTIELDGASGDTSGLIFRVAEARGEYDVDRAIVLAGRSHQGAAGAHLLVPLRLSDGTAVMVNRGWVPALDAAKIDPTDHVPTGPVRARGLLIAFPEIRSSGDGSRSDGAPPEDFRRLWYRMDIERWQAQSPYHLAPVYIQELPVEPAGRIPVPLPEPELDDGPHLGYAIQWFSFALIALVGWTVLLIRRREPASPRPPRSVPSH